MKKNLLILCSLSIITFFAQAQVSVSKSNNLQSFQNQLVGEGLEISNFEVKGSLNQIGVFNDPVQVLGLGTGIIMATGDISVAAGPNNKINQGTSFFSNINDDLLNELSANLNVSYTDAIIVEFDFVPKGSVFSLKYVMASEEYIEDDERYPDFFGFWITGPGIVKPLNLAKIPNTNVDVNTGSINDVQNKELYNNNGDGTTPLFNPFLGFDGYTDVLKAEVDVIPCQKYHMKMAIADAIDSNKDSGVFIETKSISSQVKPILGVNYESDDKKLIEDCADATLTLTLNNISNAPVVFNVNYSGTATEKDFNELPKTFTLEAGKKSTSFNYQAIKDALETEENLQVEISPVCDLNFKLDKITLPVVDFMKREIPDFVFCNKDTFELNLFDAKKDKLQFETSKLLSCTNCTNPLLFLTGNETIDYVFQDIKTECKYIDSFQIKEFKPFVEYSLDTSAYYTVLDIAGEVKNTNMDRFEWDFGTKKYYGKSIIHQTAITKNDQFCVDLELTSFEDSLNCQLKKDTTVCKNYSLTIPNIITPNLDQVNDFFVLKGISPGFWSLKIYNRYGKEIYYSPSYDFDFNAQGISDGTYFYFLENKFKDKIFKGWLQIIR